MSTDKKYVGILTTSPALGSILAMVLDCEEQLVVHNFTFANNLVRHMRIAPIDIIVCDYEIGRSSAAELAIELQSKIPERKFQIIALSEFVSERTRQACKFANIDEVIIKPMSPLFVRDRIFSRLDIDKMAISNRPQTGDENQYRHNHAKYDNSNVIELFGGNNSHQGEELHP